MQKFIRSLLLFISINLISQELFAQVYGEPIVTWDFANGIPQDWIVGINSTTDLAHWEYRGPNTEPNTTVGARGSCSAIAVPIQSMTRDNGFVIFDGNYWDDAGNACGAGLGSGVDPAPHAAWLTTSTLDFTDISSAVLTFQQQFRHYQTTTKVLISTDLGTTWTEILSNSNTVQSPNAEWRSVNISQWAANQPNVQFKFIYSGIYYWWLLDDITVYIPNDNDLLLTSVGYTNNPDLNGLPSVANLEYNQYPQLLLPILNFNANAINVGSYNQTGSALNVSVIKNGTTEVFNQSSNAVTTPAGQSGSFAVQTAFTPSGTGDYAVYFALQQDSIDDTPFNNIDSLDFSVTPYTYAKDEGPMEDVFVADSFYEEYQGAFGNFFNNPDVNRYCHSVQVGIAEGTSLGKQIRAAVYNQNYDTLLAVTNVYDVNYGDLNEPGEERMVYLDFNSPFVMLADSTYLIMVQEMDSIEPFFIARSGKSYGESSLIRYPNINASLISARSFQVRLSLFAASAHPGCIDAQAMNFESSATIADGSCRYPGCTNEDADNFTATANFDDGTCVVGGCMIAEAANYDAFATYDNGTCRFPGCTSANALNYDPSANDDDGSCRFLFTAIEAIDLTGCPPLTFQVTNHNQIDSNTVCNYAINGTTVSQACSGSFTYMLNESGFYELTYTISVGNAFADTTIYIEVLPTPSIPELTYNSADQMIICSNCVNELYQWYFDGQVVENAQASQISSSLFGQTQNGMYTLEVFNELGCGGYSTDIEILEPSLTSSVVNGCIPLTIEFFNTTDTISSMICALNSAITTIEDFSGSSEITFEAPGTYAVELTCTGATTTSSVLVNIEAYDQFVPELAIDQINVVVSCTNCSNAQNIIWNIDGTIVTGGTQQALGGDIYQIQASNAAGCGGSDLLIVNETPETQFSENSIFPNPAIDQLNIVSSPEARITVYDFTGKQVWNSSSKTSMHKFSVTSWAEGIYLVRIKTQEETFEKKILIQH